MKTEAEWINNVLVLRLRGALTMQNSDGLVAQLKAHLKTPCRGCVLDASGLEQLDSSGVGGLMTCLSVAREHKVELHLSGLTGRPLQSLQVARADRYLPLHPTVPSAIESIGVESRH